MKKGYPKDPLDKCQWTIEYNKKITFMAVVTIKKKGVVGHKKNGWKIWTKTIAHLHHAIPKI